MDKIVSDHQSSKSVSDFSSDEKVSPIQTGPSKVNTVKSQQAHKEDENSFDDLDLDSSRSSAGKQLFNKLKCEVEQQNEMDELEDLDMYL